MLAFSCVAQVNRFRVSRLPHVKMLGITHVTRLQQLSVCGGHPLCETNSCIISNGEVKTKLSITSSLSAHRMISVNKGNPLRKPAPFKAELKEIIAKVRSKYRVKELVDKVLSDAKVKLLTTKALSDSKVTLIMTNVLSIPKVKEVRNKIRYNIWRYATWYERVSGLDAVRESQEKVVRLEDHFARCQEKRRHAHKELIEVSNKLKSLHSEIEMTAKGEEKRLKLVTREHELINEEKKLVDNFVLIEWEERESFTVLSAALKESHQKEKAYAERTKYWSVIASILGTIIGVIGSSINSHKRLRELRQMIHDTIAKYKVNDVVGRMPEILTEHEKELSSTIKEMKAIASQENADFGRFNELLDKLESKLNNQIEATTQFSQKWNLDQIKLIEDYYRKQEQLMNRSFQQLVSLYKDRESAPAEASENQQPENVEYLEKLVTKHYKLTQAMFVVSVILTVISYLRNS